MHESYIFVVLICFEKGNKVIKWPFRNELRINKFWSSFFVESSHGQQKSGSGFEELPIPLFCLGRGAKDLLE